MRSRAQALLYIALATLAASAFAVAETVAAPGSGGGIAPGSGPSSTGSPAEAGDGTFPLRGRHKYGDGLGAGRGHQGQDLLAKCGKPVVAATAGRVEVKDYQAAGAGNFVVVSGGRSGFDYVYMHMLGDVVVSEGERVQAGDPIGRVGTTGSSSACHLHFEMWSAPGWYQGGRVVDPNPYLKDWDSAG